VLSLERAKAAPLKIYLARFCVEDHRWFPGVFAPYVRNTEVVSVDYALAIELKKIHPNFPQSMPSLRLLTLMTLVSDSDRDRSTDPFESFAPILKCLSLEDIPLYPLLRKIRTLTELSLYDYQFNLQ
jgi:hypothetical protein